MLTDDWPTLDVLRIRYIQSVLEQTEGNKTRAAELLGIDRRTLNRILARERAKQAAAARFRATRGAVIGGAPRTPAAGTVAPRDPQTSAAAPEGSNPPTATTKPRVARA